MKGYLTPEDYLFPEKECRLVLIGKTGSGKSSTGNTILGHKAFKAQAGINSETKQCGRATSERNGLQISVMDTPGLSDTDGDDSLIADRITKSLLAVRPGPHSIILVLKGNDRFTGEEVKVYEALKDIFGQEMTKYLIIVFVGKDRLPEGYLFEEQVEKATKLKPILTEANNRYLVFNNKATGNEQDEQVDKLLGLVKDVVRENHRACFRYRLAEQMDGTMHDMVIEEVEQMIGRKLSIPRRSPCDGAEAVREGTKREGTEREGTEREGTEKPMNIKKDMEDLERSQTVKANRALFEPKMRKSYHGSEAAHKVKSGIVRSQRATMPTDHTRPGFNKDTFSDSSSKDDDSESALGRPDSTRNEKQHAREGGQKSLAELLEELDLQDKFVDQLLTKYPQERSNVQLAEEAVLNKLLNKEEKLTAGQKQLLKRSETLVDAEIKTGLKKQGISDVSVLSKCSLM